MKRSEAREAAFLLIFEASFNPNPDGISILELAQECRDIKTDEYSHKLFLGILEKLEEIDTTIDKFCIKWSRKRLSRVALAALRIAFYEIANVDDMVAPVAINEAVNLVKKYDTPESAAFVNGILGAFVKSE